VSEELAASDVLDFWFEEVDPKAHWVKDAEFDATILRRFASTHRRAAQAELWRWRDTARGRLAEIIVLDQFSRNMFRDTAQAFDHDPLALALAQEAVAAGVHNDLSDHERSFVYLPFMHSESPLVHERAVELYRELGVERSLDFELRHKKIIDRFGRYPHRNAALGRQSTEEELEYLKHSNW